MPISVICLQFQNKCGPDFVLSNASPDCQELSDGVGGANSHHSLESRDQSSNMAFELGFVKLT
jgi:hypothetical protein